MQYAHGHACVVAFFLGGVFKFNFWFSKNNTLVSPFLKFKQMIFKLHVCSLSRNGKTPTRWINCTKVITYTLLQGGYIDF